MNKKEVSLESLQQLLDKSALAQDEKELFIDIAESQQHLVDLIKELVDAKRYDRVRVIKILKELIGYNPEDTSPAQDNGSVPDDNKDLESSSENTSQNDSDKEKEKTKRSKKGVDDHKYAAIHIHKHKELEPQDKCPVCGRGRVYRYKDKAFIVILGAPPLRREKHVIEQFRCNACQRIFSAELPENIPKTGKGDPSAMATIMMIHHKAGLAINQLSELQKITGLEMSRQELYGILKQGEPVVEKIFTELENSAADAILFHCDDTNARILEHYKENDKNRRKPRRGKKKQPEDRVATYTSNIIAELPAKERICLYFTGRCYSGENLERLLSMRTVDDAPIVMSDAHSCNKPGEQDIVECKCLAHALRKFKDLHDKYQDETEKIIPLFQAIYKNDRQCIDKPANERLKYHQEHSQGTVIRLKETLDRLETSLEVEPNGQLGQAVSYTLKNWDGLTKFMKVPGAPLDNNASERALKVPIRHRKNSLFNKTKDSAQYSSQIRSLIETAKNHSENVWDYLKTIFENENAVLRNPSSWLPWNYKGNVQD